MPRFQAHQIERNRLGKVRTLCRNRAYCCIKMREMRRGRLERRERPMKVMGKYTETARVDSSLSEKDIVA